MTVTELSNRGQTTMSWQCFFLNRTGNIESVDEIDASLNEVEAIELCRLILVSMGSYDQFELWQDGRCVHAESKRALAS